MNYLKPILLVFISLVIWTTIIGYGFIGGFLLRPLTSDDSPESFVKAAKERIAEEYVGNLALVLIENGEVSADYYFGVDQTIDENSVFLVASVSKWVTSFGIMKLVEEGELDLDAPIEDYLTRWYLPESEYDHSKVTIRRLLSHSSGLVDDLGYGGFGPGEVVQTLEESLTSAADGYYPEAAAIIGYEPGSRYMYSGAGYTILQMIIEEVRGQGFQEYMMETVFEPLGMSSSTFVVSAKPDLPIVRMYTSDGEIAQAPKFTALAAASLYTSPKDLAIFLKANVSENPVLSEASLAKMSEAQTFINELGVYGLGPHLYSQNDPNSLVIGHDGSGGEPDINTAARIDLVSKSGVIVLETGNHDIASGIADEWLFWKAGIADYVVMMRNKNYLLTLLIFGYVLIIGLSLVIIRKQAK